MARWRSRPSRDARHSALHERLADRLAGESGWISAAEVSYSIYGERGVIDRLAFHGERRMLVVFEIKAELSDPAGFISQMDRYRRLAPRIAAERGWGSELVSNWAVIAETNTNRRRLAAIAPCSVVPSPPMVEGWGRGFGIPRNGSMG